MSKTKTSSPDEIEKVFKVLRKNYILVPLEVFADHPYKTLVSTLLSSRTNDDVTLVSSQRLFEKANDVLALSKLTESEITKLIYPVGFYKTKGKNLKKLAKIVLEQFEGEVPKTREELMSLPGVGRKTANLVLNRAFGIPAIAVDIHVHRITNLLGWVKTTSPEKTELALNDFLPKKYWPETNKLFVSLGRQHRTLKSLIEFLKKEKLI